VDLKWDCENRSGSALHLFKGFECLDMWFETCCVCGVVRVRHRGPRSATPTCSVRCGYFSRTGGAITRPCKRCGKPYPRSYRRQYCSVACRKGGGRTTYERKCMVCGRAFAGTRKSVRFCSPACVGRARRTSFLKTGKGLDEVHRREGLPGPETASRAELLQGRSEVVTKIAELLKEHGPRIEEAEQLDRLGLSSAVDEVPQCDGSNNGRVATEKRPTYGGDC
jgi:hypothetical protein